MDKAWARGQGWVDGASMVSGYTKGMHMSCICLAYGSLQHTYLRMMNDMACIWQPAAHIPSQDVAATSALSVAPFGPMTRPILLFSTMMSWRTHPGVAGWVRVGAQVRGLGDLKLTLTTPTVDLVLLLSRLLPHYTGYQSLPLTLRSYQSNPQRIRDPQAA